MKILDDDRAYLLGMVMVIVMGLVIVIPTMFILLTKFETVIERLKELVLFYF